MSKALSEAAREIKRNEVKSEIVSTGEAMEILEISRPRLHQLKARGIFEQVGYGVFLKADITAYKIAFDAARENNEWLRDFK